MNLNEEQIETLKDLIDQALHTLYKEDYQLIENRVHERSIAFRFGLYFDQLIHEIDEFSNLQVDAEYNRNLEHPKRTNSRPNTSAPDILLHERMSHERNIVVLEFKGYWNRDDRITDKLKLVDFTSPDQDYQYGLGVLIEINLNKPDIIYFENGLEL